MTRYVAFPTGGTVKQHIGQVTAPPSRDPFGRRRSRNDPVGRLATADAAMIALLCSEEAGCITEEVAGVNGGS